MIGRQSTRDIGCLGEKMAAKHLKRKGYRIIARNRHLSHNELDIIAANRTHILFVEVKTRTLTSSFHADDAPSNAVNKQKQKHLLDAARAYLRQHPTSKQPRMDVIEVWLNEDAKSVYNIAHIENAFGGR